MNLFPIKYMLFYWGGLYIVFGLKVNPYLPYGCYVVFLITGLVKFVQYAACWCSIFTY